ncbi:hypothetical protein ACHAWF_015746 [Thalassiosira exigua]
MVNNTANNANADGANVDGKGVNNDDGDSTSSEGERTRGPNDSLHHPLDRPLDGSALDNSGMTLKSDPDDESARGFGTTKSQTGGRGKEASGRRSCGTTRLCRWVSFLTSFVSCDGSGPLSSLLGYRPTHVVHLAGTRSDALLGAAYRGVGDEAHHVSILTGSEGIGGLRPPWPPRPPLHPTIPLRHHDRLRGSSRLADEILAASYRALHGVLPVGIRTGLVYNPRGFGVPSAGVPLGVDVRGGMGGGGVQLGGGVRGGAMTSRTASLDVGAAEATVQGMYGIWAGGIREREDEQAVAEAEEAGGEEREEEARRRRRLGEHRLLQEVGWGHLAHDRRDFVFVEGKQLASKRTQRKWIWIRTLQAEQNATKTEGDVRVVRLLMLTSSFRAKNVSWDYVGKEGGGVLGGRRIRRLILC